MDAHRRPDGLPSRHRARRDSALVEYLASTFALADDGARQALTEFLENPDEGIFRGRYAGAHTSVTIVV